MKVTIASVSIPESGAVAIFVAKDNVLSGAGASLDETTNGSLTRAMKNSRFNGGKGSSLEILAPAGTELDRILLVGTGELSELKEIDHLELGATVVAKLITSGSTEVSIIADLEELNAAAIAEGALLRSYRFDKYRTKEPENKKPSLQDVKVATDQKNAADDFKTREAVASGVFFTRDLITEPANILYPESFANLIRDLGGLGVEVEVLGEKEMEELGMGALLGVGQGSARESQLAIMRWNGASDPDAQPIAFVGKGVTFDTGGISLKPGPGMEQMKWDMGGAGTVVGLVKALASRKAKVNVVAIVGLVENMPSSTAQRPGDVVTSMSGQTIEVLNTDAEGRLVLADALWYCQDRYKPKFMIDLATLTGAMIISLGHEYAGHFTDSDELSSALFSAGDATGDKTWRMPLHANYDKQINCQIADMQNIGGKGAGSITAAQFLKRFTNDVPWVHIDIAGTVWSDKDLPLSEKGGTGYGVRLLDRFVADNYEE
ncbi:putative cytosol aminopeptidase [Kordiimonas sediminis]|uniref:Probable cytosol aminopeptidase n=1 Tax=Kordiimonas sediminis TaxID=1735581 RepID=A0A919E9N3_9PROT|nr:leucyl aminopeptidase [Kordiimonas sediminis]GHF27658.1 putative cytosol aminopeptidase [Kordiimonas sediminis]